jgi:UDP-N-acetylmuramate--alanine ligase
MSIKDIGTVYFVGIGGIGMSALARFFLGRGIRVHGYDRTSTPLTDQLTREGAVIHFEEAPNQIPGQTDLAGV